MAGTGTRGESEPILIPLRRILRASDVHSKHLFQQYGVTVSQLLILRQAHSQGRPTVGEIAEAVNLTQGTVTTIVNRLESAGFINRRRDDKDRRKVRIWLTRAGENLLERTPPLLQEHFMERFQRLKDWEQNLLVSSLQRIAGMMEADEMEVVPVLTTEDEAELNDGEG
jgi:DNA-binding MarR family transcriptional regulator